MPSSGLYASKQQRSRAAPVHAVRAGSSVHRPYHEAVDIDVDDRVHFPARGVPDLCHCSLRRLGLRPAIAYIVDDSFGRHVIPSGSNLDLVRSGSIRLIDGAPLGVIEHVSIRCVAARNCRSRLNMALPPLMLRASHVDAGRRMREGSCREEGEKKDSEPHSRLSRSSAKQVIASGTTMVAKASGGGAGNPFTLCGRDRRAPHPDRFAIRPLPQAGEVKGGAARVPVRLNAL